MKSRSKNYLPVFYLSVSVFSVLIFCCSPLFAQNLIASKDEIHAPSEEEFSAAFDVLAPWRETGCGRGNILYKEPNCPVIRNDVYVMADTLTLYDKDGDLWYRFSLTPSKDDYLLKNKRDEFSPLAMPFLTINPYLPRKVLLRMTGESEHWYEVEINEKTRETKFALKTDPMWAKTNWSYWLYHWTNLKIDGAKVKLLDKPDGKVIESSAEIEFDTVKFLKADGDWAYVEGYHNNREYAGWVCWRDGRDILVGCIFNDNKVPESKTNGDLKTND
jgi:hypothetical protein